MAINHIIDKLKDAKHYGHLRIDDFLFRGTRHDVFQVIKEYSPFYFGRRKGNDFVTSASPCLTIAIDYAWRSVKNNLNLSVSDEKPFVAGEFNPCPTILAINCKPYSLFDKGDNIEDDEVIINGRISWRDVFVLFSGDVDYLKQISFLHDDPFYKILNSFKNKTN